MLTIGPGVPGCSDDDASSKSGASEAEKTARPAGEYADQEGEPADNEGGTDPLKPLASDEALPIVFVHGFAGSAQQFDSQAMRYVANGYPAERLRAYDHDGAGLALDAFVTGLDAVIDDVRATFHTDKVYLIGHSRGTSVSSQYLSTPEQAAKVAKYVALDGAGCTDVPIPCVAPAQTTNTRPGQTHPLPGQKHVEVATSKESFEVQFEFLFGKKPEVLEVVKQRAPVELSGRAVNFPANTGRDGTRLEVWKIDSETGMRDGAKPLATFEIGADGGWGPITVKPDRHYEFVLIAADQTGNHHFYMQHFLRSTRFVRLLSGPPDSDARLNSHIGDEQANLTVSRMREWTPDDVLEVGTQSESGDQEARNVISDATGANRIAIYIQDDAATPKESTLALLPWFPEQPFQTGVDLYIPSNKENPDGTITLVSEPRGDADEQQVLHVPNWSSSKHTVSVLFSDFPQP